MNGNQSYNSKTSPTKTAKQSFLSQLRLIIASVVLIYPFGSDVLSQEIPFDYPYWAQLCESLYQAQEYEQAKDACSNAISFNPKDAIIWETWGDILLRFKEYPQALIAYQKYLQLNRNSSFAYSKQCEILYYLTQYENAIAACETALKKDNDWQNASMQRAWYFRGEGFKGLNQLENAQVSYNWAIKLDASYSPGFSGLCFVFLQQKQYQSALDACQTARQNDNWDGIEDVQARENEGEVYQELQDYPNALNAYNEALARNPQNGLIWRKKAEALQFLGDYGKAITANEWALQFMPGDRQTLTQQCALINLTTQAQPSPPPEGYTQALESCDKALQVGNGSWGELGAAYAWNQRGNALIGLGRYEEAVVSLKQALSLQPDYPEAWNNLSVAFWYLENYAQALTSVEKALSLNPTDSQAWFNKGRILTQQQQYEDAIIAYNQALDGDIKYQNPAKKATIWLNQSAVFWQLQEHEAALDAAEKALAVEPDNQSQQKALYNKSLALIALQNYSEAEETLKSLLKISPDNQAAQEAIKFIQQLNLGGEEEQETEL
ncbi:tetratricopeptide repeat protein [Crocosphaera sp.]|uniref:tetratricopeptide repeat protein n=1 Tax=Crocosphaera sp. TaxID=2729996 RepID=UPI003F2118C7|nr:tetratricopeptide repeat protein [Crocosphaera sp.]